MMKLVHTSIRLFNCHELFFLIMEIAQQDNLPDHLIIKILSRLNDSTELARCKCVSKTLNTLGRQIRSIHLYCSLDRYTKMRSPSSNVTPFKAVFHKLISNAEAPIESVSLGMEESLDRFYGYDYQFENKSDDLFLTAGPFSDGWMTNIGHGLKSISIRAFRPQAFYPETNILEVISYNCHSLVELTLNNAGLYVDNMHMMPLLTKLTLKQVEISDESLNKLMECLSCLQVFVMTQSYCGSTDPKIYHLNLKELVWKRCRDPLSMTVFAPNLTTLELECDSRVSIHAPLLSYLYLALESVYGINIEKFKTLKTLCLVSSRLHYVLSIFSSSPTVQNLTLDSPGAHHKLRHDERIELSDVFTAFPEITSLTLGSEVWLQLMLYPSSQWALVGKGVAKGLTERLEQITGYFVLEDIDITLAFILYVKRVCSNLKDVVLFIHCNDDLSVASFVSLCMSLCPKVRFRWRTWESGLDACISNSIVGVAN